MQAVKQIGAYWDERESKFDKNLRLYWYQHPMALSHYRNMVIESNEDSDKKPIYCYLQEKYPGRKFEKGVSIGCGSAHKEIQLVADGVVGSFDLYELSAKVIERGREHAEKLGLSEQINFHQRDLFDGAAEDLSQKFDLVHWDNALHHMFSVKDAINLSTNMLKKGGVLVIDDYVGPSYMQASEECYLYADSIRNLLDEKYLKNNSPNKESHPLLPTSPRIPKFRFLETDPSEMADSANILPEIELQCPGAHVIKTGGILFFLGLRPLFGNFDENSSEDKALLDKLLKLDEKFTKQTGITFHGFVCWEKA